MAYFEKLFLVVESFDDSFTLFGMLLAVFLSHSYNYFLMNIFKHFLNLSQFLLAQPERWHFSENVIRILKKLHFDHHNFLTQKSSVGWSEESVLV